VITATGETVIDSSVIVALVTPEVHSRWSRQKIAAYNRLHILDLSHYEVANALRYKAENHSLINTQAAWSTAQNLMNISIHHTYTEVINRALSEAKNLNIAVYDAVYVLLADKLDIPFLTVDIKLTKRLEGTKYHSLLDFPNQ
jgi:predicted nucleic acid-binding protein